MQSYRVVKSFKFQSKPTIYVKNIDLYFVEIFVYQLLYKM